MVVDARDIYTEFDDETQHIFYTKTSYEYFSNTHAARDCSQKSYGFQSVWNGS